jgi:DHA2 family multidrug resistance protein
MLDQGEREDWFASSTIAFLAVLAVVAIAAFVVRELTTREPIMSLDVFNDRNFAVGSVVMAGVGFGFYASTVLLALYTQKLMGYDAWTSGLVLAPGGVGNMTALLISGRLVHRVDQRAVLGFGCALNATAFFLMTNVTLGMDYWALAFPRFVQGFGQGFIFVPLQTLALSTVRMERLSNATSAFNVVRNFGGSVGIALATTLLARRSQLHQAAIVEHASVFDGETHERLEQWTKHFLAQGADAFTAGRRAVAMLYREAVGQAQVLAYVDVYMLLVSLFIGILFLLPWLRQARDQKPSRPGDGDGRVEGLPAAASD